MVVESLVAGGQDGLGHLLATLNVVVSVAEDLTKEINSLGSCKWIVNYTATIPYNRRKDKNADIVK